MPERDLTNIRTYNDAKTAGLPVFKVFSDGVGKAYTAEDGTRYFELTASSDSTDLAGDFFLERALKQMEDAAEGTTMFLNHSYNVPEDVFGIVESASLIRGKVKKGGKSVEVLQLVYKGIVNEDNERAVKVHNMMERKQCKLGASISVLIVDAQDQKDGRRAISDIYYLECSIVGIPCNPDCWAKAASKALNNMALSGEPPTSESVTLTAPLQNEPTPKAVPVGESSKETDMATMKVAQKGMFNNELARSEASIYHLVERILYTVLWNLYYECKYGSDEVDAAAELEMICDEFKATIMDRLLPVLQGDPSASKAANFLNTVDKALAFFAKDSSFAKAVETVTKEGRRNSSSDQQMVDDIHNLIVDLGAACKAAEATDDTTTVNKTGALVPTTKAIDDQPTDKTAPGAGAASSASVTDLESKVSSLNAQILTLTAEKTTLQTQKTALETKVSDLETKISGLETKVAEAETERDGWKACSLNQGLLIDALASTPLPRAGNESNPQ